MERDFRPKRCGPVTGSGRRALVVGGLFFVIGAPLLLVLGAPLATAQQSQSGDSDGKTFHVTPFVPKDDRSTQKNTEFWSPCDDPNNADPDCYSYRLKKQGQGKQS